MCAIRPIYKHEVTKARLDEAMTSVRDARTKLTKEQGFEVAFELGYGDGLSFTPQGELQLDLTELQLVALAAALSAVAETGGKMEYNKDREPQTIENTNIHDEPRPTPPSNVSQFPVQSVMEMVSDNIPELL